MVTNNNDYFNFSTEEELPEETTQQMKECPVCSKPIPADSLFCLYCGEPVSPTNKNKWLILVVFFILIVFLFWIFIL